MQHEGAAATRWDAFPLVLQEGSSLQLDRLDSYIASFSPVLQDLDQLRKDLQRETRFALRPILLLDYSELYHLWSSRRTLKGRHGRLDWTDALVDHVLTHGGLAPCIPAGTLFELSHRLLLDCRISVPFGASAQALATHPAAGVSDLPNLDVFVEALPSPGTVADTLDTAASLSARAHGYSDFASRLRSGKLRLLHAHDFATLKKMAWDHHAFKVALDYLNGRRPPTPNSRNNIWDALNIALTLTLNNVPNSTIVCYLIGRGGLLRNAADAVPWRRDPLVRHFGMEDRGIVRSPTYLYLRSALLGNRQSADLLTVSNFSSDLGRINDLLLLLARDPEGRSIRRAAHADPSLEKKFREAISHFQNDYPQQMRLLYDAWESYRRTVHEPFIPAMSRLNTGKEADSEDAPITTTVEEILRTAEEARYHYRKQLAGETGEPEPLLRLFEESSDVMGSHEYDYAIQVENTASPFFHIEFTQGYYSACWYSDLDIHSFLDWIDAYVYELTWYSNRYGVSLAVDRHVNATYVVTPRTIGGMGEFSSEYDEEQDDRVKDIPLSREDRADIVRAVAAGNVEALRIYTPYGDAWLNFVYSRNNRLRTGFLSHLRAPAFLAQFVALTIEENVSVRTLYGYLEHLMRRHLPELPGSAMK